MALRRDETPRITEAGPAEPRPEPLRPYNAAADKEKRPRSTLISVPDELFEHYQAVVSTRDEVLGSLLASGSEKAAVLNATTTILKDLVRLQSEAYNADSIARLQQAIVNALASADQTLKDKVLHEMEKSLASFS